jgi:hypothetical protein
MTEQTFLAMKRSIFDGAPDTAATLALEALRAGIPPLEAINLGFVPGIHGVGEQHFPSAAVARGGMAEDGRDILGRARERVDQLLAAYQRPAMSADREQALLSFATRECGKVGLNQLPGMAGDETLANRRFQPSAGGSRQVGVGS